MSYRHLPGRVATQNAWLARGLVPKEKAARFANYIKTLRRDLVKVAETCRVKHPGLISTDSVDILDGRTGSMPLHEDGRIPSARPSPRGRERRSVAVRLRAQHKPWAKAIGATGFPPTAAIRLKTGWTARSNPSDAPIRFWCNG